MNFEEFVQLSAAVRKAQKSYFKTKHPDDLKKSKELETSLDKEIKQYEEDKKPKLF